jgi:hypothetical protein
LKNIRGSNLAAVMCMTVLVSRLSWQCKLLVTRAQSAVPGLDLKRPCIYCIYIPELC